MSETVRWGLPLLASGQAQKEITHNEAILAIDRLLHPAVISRQLSVPPDAPARGDAYIIGATPGGAWMEGAGKLAVFDGMAWTLSPARPGCMAWIADEAGFAVFASGTWSTGGWPAQGLRIGDRLVLAAAPAAVAEPTGGVSADAECRAAFSALLVALRAQGVII